MNILDRIREYLSLGGLFNPELMEPQKVSNLIQECRKEIESRDKKIKELERKLDIIYSGRRSGKYISQEMK